MGGWTHPRVVARWPGEELVTASTLFDLVCVGAALFALSLLMVLWAAYVGTRAEARRLKDLRRACLRGRDEA